MSAFLLRIGLTVGACGLAWAAWEAAQRLPLGPFGVLGDVRVLIGLALIFLFLTIADRLAGRLRRRSP